MLFRSVTTIFEEQGAYCAAPVSHHVTLGEIVELLEKFTSQPSTLLMPEIPAGSFAKKLYSTYLSYLPVEKTIKNSHLELCQCWPLVIQERKIGTDEIREFEVSGEQIQAVHMLPGYTHNIINLSQTDDLVTVMWANEAFDPEHPDTFYEAV